MKTETLVALQELVFNPQLDAGLELMKRLEPLIADAERYRWLRDNHETYEHDDGKGQVSLWEHKKGCDYGMKSGKRLDAAIDAAMAAEPAVGAA